MARAAGSLHLIDLVDAVPVGLVHRLVTDVCFVRAAEVERARRSLQVVRLDDEAVIAAIADGLLDVASW